MVSPTLARAYGTLAGFGFVGVAVLTLPSTRLLDPLPAPEAYLLTLAGLVTGLICIAIPWDLLDPRWLHLVGVAATVEAAATVEVFGQPYVAFFFLIAVLVAYVSPDARTIGLQLGLICLAMFGPLLYGSEDARSSLNVALVAAPVLLMTAGLFSYLRMKMVHDRRAYHRFAEQTLVLSSQIAGRQVGPLRMPRQENEPMPALLRLRPPATALAAAAVVLGIPLFAGGLAAAGVKLPDLANKPFESIGIELPNQDDEVARDVTADERSRAKHRPPSAAAPPGREPLAGSAAKPEAATKAAADAESSAPTEPGESPALPTAPDPGGGAEAPPPEPPAPADDPAAPKPLQDLLDQATNGLQNLLDQLSQR